MRSKADISDEPASTFHDFPRLPPELRMYIWQAALLDYDTTRVFFYKPGCWQPGEVVEPDEDDPEPDRVTVDFQFWYELLDRVRVDVALTSVNREARDIAHSWAVEQGMSFDSHNASPGLILLRAFDPRKDILYVSDGLWNDFYHDFSQRARQLDLADKDLLSRSEIERVAISQPLLGSQEDIIEKLFRSYASTRVLYIVQETSSKAELDSPTPPWQRCWNIQRVPGRTSLWDVENNIFEILDEGREDNSWMFQRLELEGKSTLKDEEEDFGLHEDGFMITTAIAVQISSNSGQPLEKPNPVTLEPRKIILPTGSAADGSR